MAVAVVLSRQAREKRAGRRKQEAAQRPLSARERGVGNQGIRLTRSLRPTEAARACAKATIRGRRS